VDVIILFKCVVCVVCGWLWLWIPDPGLALVDKPRADFVCFSCSCMWHKVCVFFWVESRFVSCVSWQYRRGMSLHFVLVKKRKDGIHRSRFDGGSVILVAPYPYHKIVPIACHYHCIHC
jgi:hypothetical protein